VPAPFGWLVLLLGLVTIASCFLLPREIGKEDTPLMKLDVDLPPLEELAGRLRKTSANLEHRVAAKAAQAAQRVHHRAPAAPAPAEPPLAMGATQPVLTQER